MTPRSNANKSTRVQLNRQTRHVEWLTLYSGGMSMPRIAERYDVQTSSVLAVIKSALKQISQERHDLAEIALDVQLERLRLLLEAHMPTATTPDADHTKSVRSAEIVLRTLDRIAKLQGLDEPMRAEVTVHTIDAVDAEIAGLAKAIRDRSIENATERGLEPPETPVLDGIIEHVEQQQDERP